MFEKVKQCGVVFICCSSSRMRRQAVGHLAAAAAVPHLCPYIKVHSFLLHITISLYFLYALCIISYDLGFNLWGLTYSNGAIQWYITHILITRFINALSGKRSVGLYRAVPAGTEGTWRILNLNYLIQKTGTVETLVPTVLHHAGTHSRWSLVETFDTHFIVVTLRSFFGLNCRKCRSCIENVDVPPTPRCCKVPELPILT